MSASSADAAASRTRHHRRGSSLSSLFAGGAAADAGGRPPMESPLKQVNSEPLAHQPKVVTLYNRLFEPGHSPGYWVEFFLLKANPDELARVLRADPQRFVTQPETVHTLVRAAVANLGADLPPDIVGNALQVLSTVVGVTLDLHAAGSFPGVSVIQTLTGIENASAVFDDLTSKVLALLYAANRQLVGETTAFVLHVARKLWGTQISALFSTKNFFAALIAIIDRQIDDSAAVNALLCIGALTALNIYDDDGASVYKQRLNDYVDEAVMTKILALAQHELIPTGQPAPDQSVFSWVSSWFDRPAQAPQEQQAAEKPSVVLPLFLFTVHNSVFSSQFAASPALPALISSSVGRPPSHEWLALLTMRTLVDSDFNELTDPKLQAIIRLYTPKLVLDTSRRVPLAGILDFAAVILGSAADADADIALIGQAADLVYQVCAQMVATTTIWTYNWTQLWRKVLKAVKALVRGPEPAVISRLLTVLVGMALRRDLLEEEDWRALLFVVVQNKKLFEDVAAKFPALASQPALTAARNMTAQYELSPEQPDFVLIQRQGGLAGRVIGEKLRPFSASLPAVKRAVRAEYGR